VTSPVGPKGVDGRHKGGHDDWSELKRPAFASVSLNRPIAGQARPWRSKNDVSSSASSCFGANCEPLHKPVAYLRYNIAG
jgi:hypothetical protein